VCGKRHHTTLHRDRDPGAADQARGNPGTSSVNVAKPSGPGRRRTVLQTALVRVPGVADLARVLLDSGAELSYVASAFAAKIAEPRILETREHSFEAFGGHVSTHRAAVHSMQLMSRHSEDKVQVRLLELPRLCSALRGLELRPEIGTTGPLADGQAGEHEQVDILLGMDVLPHILRPEPVRREGGLLLTETIFGLVISGQVADRDASSFAALAKVMRSSAAADAVLENLWKLDVLGIKMEEEVPAPVAEPVFAGIRYEVGLPWLGPERPQLSAAQAERRLGALCRHTAERQAEYRAVLQEYQDMAILEPTERDGGSYLPYHAVWTAGKLRLVYDASAKPWKGPALNELLAPGPNLLEKLHAILVRFRCGEVPVCADVTKAFLMVGVRPEDRDYLKIARLGPDGAAADHLRFARVPFGLNCGPYLLLATMEKLFQDSEQAGDVPQPILDHLRDLYMDDVVTTFSAQQQAVDFRAQAQEVLQRAGMTLRKFVSSPSVMEDWGEEPKEDHRVLGIRWRPAADTLHWRLEMRQATTKREVASSVAAFFDPLGLASPWTIRPRVFLQGLWVRGGSWDESLSPDLAKEWSELIDEAVREDVELSIPRHVPLNGDSFFEVFGDASGKAYASALYVTTLGRRQLLCAKARVAPLRPKMSIARLELMGALCSVRLLKFVREQLRLPDLPALFFTDSEVVLAWMHNPPRRDVFARNRIREILAHTEPASWAYVNTKVNPADLATRGVTPSQLVHADLWWRGPLTPTPAPTRGTIVLCAVEMDPDPLNLARLGPWPRLLRIVCYVQRFYLRIAERSPLLRRALRGEEGVPPRERARSALLRYFQQPTAEYRTIAEGRTLPATSPLWDARPTLSSTGVLVCQPRTGGAALPWLPPGPLGVLMVTFLHRELGHLGTPTLAGELQRAFWVTHPRRFVKRHLQRCGSCRRHDALPMTSPEGRLPDWRANPAPPFSHTGLDHFGPIHLRDGAKRWVLLLTCAVTRAVHLEVVPRLDIDSTAKALQRFASRRGTPTLYVSDNGSAFVALAGILNATSHIWRLIPQASPWWGGFYERMVGTVKRAAKKTLGRAAVSEEDLSTLLCQLEAGINRRPLVPSDSGGITPAHFLFGAAPPPLHKMGGTGPPGHSNGDVLTRLLRHRQKLSGLLWDAWERDYLSTLRTWRTAGRPRGPHAGAAGDIVLVHPPDGTRTPRERWRLGRIIRLLQGPDGRSRAAELLVGGLITRRPLSRLYALEAVEPQVPDVEPQVPDVEPQVPDVEPQVPDVAQVPDVDQMPDLNPAPDPVPVHTRRHGRAVVLPERFRD
jgi:hypothetical protein